MTPVICPQLEVTAFDLGTPELSSSVLLPIFIQRAAQPSRPEEHTGNGHRHRSNGTRSLVKTRAYIGYKMFIRYKVFRAIKILYNTYWVMFFWDTRYLLPTDIFCTDWHD